MATQTKWKQLIEDVKAKTDIVQVIGQRISLNGRNKAICPFHKEKNASLSVKPEAQYFKCFGCDVGGDVFDFLRLFERRSFTEVLTDLATQAGIPMPNFTREDRARMEGQRVRDDILADTSRFYKESITKRGLHYLIDRRGLSRRIIRRFCIGYARGGLREYLVNQRGHPTEACVEAGVLKKTRGGTIEDYFRNRVIFPHLVRGRVVNITGRVIGTRGPKYLHLPGPIDHMYNEDALRHDEPVVAEGIFDCLSSESNGFPAVALLGVNLKGEHESRFRDCKLVYVCLDGDEAGEKAAAAIGHALGEKARIARLPHGLDLNDYHQEHSVDDFERLLAKSKSPVSAALDIIPTDIPKVELPHLLKSILQLLAKLDNATSEAWLSHEIKVRFGLTGREIDTYREELKRVRRDLAKESIAPVVENHAQPCAIFDGLVDVVEYEDQPAFLIKHDEELSITVQETVEDCVVRPPSRDKIPWLLPRGENVLEIYDNDQRRGTEADETLYDDLLRYHKSISELPDDGDYDLLAAWVMHTYLVESAEYSPIVCLFAVPERGKSRTGKGMIHVAYRGIHVESLRDAYLIRIAENWRASILFDVKNLWKKAEKCGSEDVVLHRFERGAKVPRVIYPDRGPHEDTVYYSIFGPTIIATNESIHRILETRAISINMPEATRSFERDVTPKGALDLKDRLLAFRARHMDDELPDVPKPAPGRLGDIMRPLLQMVLIAKPDREDAFRQVVARLQEERQMEKSTSLEAQLLQVIRDLDDEVGRGILSVKQITEAFNNGKLDREIVTPQRIGRRLSAMGFDKSKTSNGSSAILWNEKKIDQMCSAYGLSSETSETAVTPSSGSNDTG